MSVNTQIYLPHDVEVHDVANVIALASGLTYVLRPTRNSNQTVVYIPRMSVTMSSGNFPMAKIKVVGQLADGQNSHEVYYHFEDCEFPEYSRLLMPVSSPYWLAIGKRLIDFFGGLLIFDDCDREKFIERPKPIAHYDSGNDEQYLARQRAFLGVHKLTATEIDDMRQHAAYPDD